MEGGNSLIDWISYGILGFVLFALGVLVVRSAWFFLSLLAIPLTDTLARRTRLGGAIRRWGERGADPPPRAVAEAGDVIEAAAPAQAPFAVRRGAGVGAAIGALPGLWLGARGAMRTLGAGGSVAAALADAALGVGLVSAAGVLVGTAVGAAIGLAWDALRGGRR